MDENRTAYFVMIVGSDAGNGVARNGVVTGWCQNDGIRICEQISVCVVSTDCDDISPGTNIDVVQAELDVLDGVLESRSGNGFKIDCGRG